LSARPVKRPKARPTTRRSSARAKGRAGRVRILVLSGPNLDRLGAREPEIYGSMSLDQIHDRIRLRAEERKAEAECRQSNHEGALIDWIGAASDEGFAGILLNAAALTHTSYALLDAVRATSLPVVEVHLSNPEAREEFRRHSCVAPACVGKVAGFGPASYTLALDGLLDRLGGRRAPGLDGTRRA
jgi:3-dehydroquinate dehydratase II